MERFFVSKFCHRQQIDDAKKYSPHAGQSQRCFLLIFHEDIQETFIDILEICALFHPIGKGKQA